MSSKTYRLNEWISHGVAEGPSTPYYTIKQFRGSAFGLGSTQMKSIQDEWRIGLLDNKCDALAFLKEYADLS